MRRIPTKPPTANVLERISERARAFLRDRGVDLAQASGLEGVRGRPSASPRLDDQPPAPAKPATPPARRDRRARVVIDLAAERARRRRERDTRYERRFARLMTELGVDEPEGGWRSVPRDVWVMAWDCVGDGTGHALRHWMRRERNKVAVGAARVAALADGQRTWADQTARRIMTCALVQLRMSEPTKRRGRWSELVRGIPVGAFAAMLTPPSARGRVPHRNTLSGRHRGAGSAARRGQNGYFRELELAGFMYAQQLPADQVEAFERCGTSGHACNRYWLLSPNPSSVDDQAERERLIELHRAGQRAATEVLGRPLAIVRNAPDSRAQALRAAVFGPPPHPPPE